MMELILFFIIFSSISYQIRTQCYDNKGAPLYCEPSLDNISFNESVETTSTYENYSSFYLTDLHDDLKPTWWRSKSMIDGIQYPNSVNLTFSFHKLYDIRTIQLIFNSPRPESLLILKKNRTLNSNWQIVEYFSSSCDFTYPDRNGIRCNNEFSDITPLSGGILIFSPNHLIATNILIMLHRLNTFGDEIFGKPEILKSYYYSISDIKIEAMCHCNGHASKCVFRQALDFEERLQCECHHNTFGTDCNYCLPFYQDLPWKPSTIENPFECKPCNCNGNSEKCFFDEHLYNQTGHGTHCLNCLYNTEGFNCEKCQKGFYKEKYTNKCIACNCNKFGSIDLDCDSFGQCYCKPGVTGYQCDTCMKNYFGLGSSGCQKCECNRAGISNTDDYCDRQSGKCFCKENVEGLTCDKCKIGFYNLDKYNPRGCTKCFCFGHTYSCESAGSFYESFIKSSFENETEEWMIVDSYGVISRPNYNQTKQSIYEVGCKKFWFLAPKIYLGNQINSYDQYLTLKVSNGQKNISIVLDNSHLDMSVKVRVLNEHNDKRISVKLSETNDWTPKLSSSQFKLLLSNLSSIRIKSSDFSSNVYLEDFTLNTANYLNFDLMNAKINSIENCSCPLGYNGLLCENCQEGYHRVNKVDNLLDKCVKCSCNNHSKTCNSITGKCYCEHNTEGDNCEKCVNGYYGNPLIGSPNDCKKCNCIGNGPCRQIFNSNTKKFDINCFNCPSGHVGNKCESCTDGYFMKDKNCVECNCSSNIDINSLGNCDPISGKCTRCIYNTTGNNCEQCLPGYYGNALSTKKCRPCDCNLLGSKSTECDQLSGKCNCKKNVEGLKCDRCVENFWNIQSKLGCIECECDMIGSISQSCNTVTGQCKCLRGVSGLKCNICEHGYFNFTESGCSSCDCYPYGTKSQQCDQNGICHCKDNYKGKKCDQCVENYFNNSGLCQKCDRCFELVQERVENLKARIKNCQNLNTPIIINSQKSYINEIVNKFMNLNESIVNMYDTFVDGERIVKSSQKKKICSLIEFVPRKIIDNFKNRELSYEKNLAIIKLLEPLHQRFSYAELQLNVASSHIDQAKYIINSIVESYHGPNFELTKFTKLSREKASSFQSLVTNAKKQLYIFLNDSNQIDNDLSIVIDNIISQSNAKSNFEYEFFMEHANYVSKNLIASRDLLLGPFIQIKASIKILQEKGLHKLFQENDVFSTYTDILLVNLNISNFQEKIQEIYLSNINLTQIIDKLTYQQIKVKFDNLYHNLKNLLRFNNSLLLKQTAMELKIVELNKIFLNVSTLNKLLKPPNVIRMNDKRSTNVLAELEREIDSYKKFNVKFKYFNQVFDKFNKSSENLFYDLHKIKRGTIQENSSINKIKVKTSLLERRIRQLNHDSKGCYESIKGLEFNRTIKLNTQNKIIAKTIKQTRRVEKLHNSIAESYSRIDSFKNISEIIFINYTEQIRNLEKVKDLMLNITDKKYDERINYLKDKNNALKLSISEIEKRILFLIKDIQKLQSLSRQLDSKKCLLPKRFNFFEIK